MASPKRTSRVPWFIFAINSDFKRELANLGNRQFSAIFRAIDTQPTFFSSRIVPEAITSNKPINYSDKAVAGGRTSIPQFGNFGATTLSFSLRYASMNDTLGVTRTQKFFESLRNPETGIFSSFAQPFSADEPFRPNPKVLYYYGTNSVPMVYFVTKCNFTLSSYNTKGFAQVIDVSLELVLDESGALFEAERLFRSTINAASLIGAIGNKEKSSTYNPYYSRDEGRFSF